MPVQRHWQMSDREMVYGYDGVGWKNGNYYSSYISPNPKFYTKHSWYGKELEIYTPFWNIMTGKYQNNDCGVDCDYLGPRNFMMSMTLYVVLAAVFVTFLIVVGCTKEKLDIQRPIQNI